MTPNVPGIKHSSANNFFLIAGPCVIENEHTVLQTVETLVKVTDELKIPFIFKSSFRKANRSKIDSFTGIGNEKGLNILSKIKETFQIPVITDIHLPHEAELAAGYVDVLQIPAFLCRQTDLLVAAAKTGKYVNIKKGQFLSPNAMKYAVEKVTGSGNHYVMVTERGTFFGYQDLIVDFRSIPDMKAMNVPVVLDITHSLQQPNQSEGVSGGFPDKIETIARAGIAAGTDGIFLETHPDPANALSDGANMLQLQYIHDLLHKLVQLHQVIRTFE
jgi:2-dehydro-3-deoxyphosphooctonate aldolase (KDO 8-P synthase)